MSELNCEIKLNLKNKQSSKSYTSSREKIQCLTVATGISLGIQNTVQRMETKGRKRGKKAMPRRDLEKQWGWGNFRFLPFHPGSRKADLAPRLSQKKINPGNNVITAPALSEVKCFSLHDYDYWVQKVKCSLWLKVILFVKLKLWQKVFIRQNGPFHLSWYRSDIIPALTRLIACVECSANQCIGDPSSS